MYIIFLHIICDFDNDIICAILLTYIFNLNMKFLTFPNWKITQLVDTYEQFMFSVFTLITSNFLFVQQVKFKQCLVICLWVWGWFHFSSPLKSGFTNLHLIHLWTSLNNLFFTILFIWWPFHFDLLLENDLSLREVYHVFLL